MRRHNAASPTTMQLHQFGFGFRSFQPPPPRVPCQVKPYVEIGRRLAPKLPKPALIGLGAVGNRGQAVARRVKQKSLRIGRTLRSAAEDGLVLILKA